MYSPSTTVIVMNTAARMPRRRFGRSTRQSDVHHEAPSDRAASVSDDQVHRGDGGGDRAEREREQDDADREGQRPGAGAEDPRDHLVDGMNPTTSTTAGTVIGTMQTNSSTRRSRGYRSAMMIMAGSSTAR